ncbi:phosphoadenylyl-sulfate reductase [Phototrophicus methaneseepsis]|uniref:Adenosine 5'-phosphosulfate reductase n=1 Tax=Phototrophicus methaneseepsis TaxID=2710758 RepID=A0A7S8EDT5_9CHLR|nr:phosphoadenylyl-sulfate reductase [Phototrophicus methaneseepsis]
MSTLQQQLDAEHPQEILRWAVETYGDKLVVVTSFQITGIVTLHMLKQITNNINVLTLDTGLLFPETNQLIETVEARLGINVQRIRPQQSLTEQARQYGGPLWESNPDQCCHLRKRIPLDSALAGYDAWITGLRRDQSATRANVPVVDWDPRHKLYKLCPFATWTEDMVWTYVNAYDLPYNALHDRGYDSIGCYTCTLAAEGREGRWANFNKTECGIHYAR